ncbi:bifunctional metallophosphatase/5'-nucleotidase [Proteiniclasticum sp. C24MP]|uniref:bifunctional metallophosphatase/5'-nucleotidase n=1 Tax=Proteiniclasticum sp. C24MP TaxID=3374101 RepID=UPI00375442DA
MESMKRLTILQMNDLHGYLDLHNEVYYDESGIRLAKAGGLPRIRTMVDTIRKETGEILFLDNGDTFHGTYEAVHSKGADLVPLLNDLALDAMTFHWDIAYGPDVLKEREKELDYPILAINVYHKETDALYMKPYMIQEVSGIKVAVIGIACNIIDKTMPKHFSEGLYFTNGLEELPGYIEEVKEKGAELVVVLSHLGFPQDMELLTRIEGVDVLISGHTHNRVHEVVRVNDALLIQSGSHGSFLGRLDLTLGEDGGITDVKHRLLDVSEDVSEHEETKQRIETIMASHRKFLDEEVGKTRVVLHRGTSLECSMDNLLLSSLLKETGAEMAFSNGWRYGAPVDVGPVTRRELHQIIPVNPPVSTCELTGKELQEMIEENLEKTYSRSPLDQMGGYVKRALGIRVYFKVENPYGQRIQEIYVGEKKLEPDKVYRACYVTNQGVPEKYGRNHEKLPVKAIDALEHYLKEETFELYEADTYILI